jgi:hypothetical protein
MSDLLDCEPVPSSIRSARLFVVDKLQEWRCDELVDGVALLTSELATNAVVHTGQPFTVGVERTGDTIRVEVVDALADLPKPYVNGDDRGLLHGLNVVDSLATSWGSEELPGGKVVWFELTGGGLHDDPSGLASLRDLRGPEPPQGFGESSAGKGGVPKDTPHLEEHDMARRSDLTDRDRLDEREAMLDERERRLGDDGRRFYAEDRRGSPVWKILLVLLVLAAAAAIAFFALGGDADVDTEGDLEVPEVDVDVNAPEVDVNSEEAPPADAEANAEDG